MPTGPTQAQELSAASRRRDARNLSTRIATTSASRFWQPLFGYSHGIMIVNFEEVSKAKLEGRELKEGEDDPSATLDFRPRPAQESVLRMLVFALGGRRGITRFVRRDDGLTAGGSCRS